MMRPVSKLSHLLRLATLALFLAAGSAQAWDLSQLMQDLARHKGGHALFTEKKYLAVLDKPLSASGELFYSPPDRLEKRTLQPKPEYLLLDGDTLIVERGKQKYTLRLADRPEVVAFVDSIRGTLAGKREVLERSYALRLFGNEEHWTLNLLPSDTRIATLVSRINVSGSRNQVLSIEYLQADGDRMVMNIEPLDGK
ncbi:MAG TPA: LolA-related protein [Azospira sp.]|nr:LolA-related protein [Azospira sp.]